MMELPRSGLSRLTVAPELVFLHCKDTPIMLSLLRFILRAGFSQLVVGTAPLRYGRLMNAALPEPAFRRSAGTATTFCQLRFIRRAGFLRLVAGIRPPRYGPLMRTAAQDHAFRRCKVLEVIVPFAALCVIVTIKVNAW